MKSLNAKVLTIATAFAVVLSIKSKCAMCHGADGKKAAGHDLSSADVQKQSDADLEAVIANGKAPKMPKYGDKLKPEEIKGLVAYIRTLK
jgi:mono/diheme cytochrome c family protein